MIHLRPLKLIKFLAMAFLWSEAALPARASTDETGPWEEKVATCRAQDFEILGLNRTDEHWLRDYLELDHLQIKSFEDIEQLQRKLMTTDIFTSARIHLDEIGREVCKFRIFVDEKWTRIPVIRGAYGGGTPLLILGGYETNAFGRLLAIGGEVRRYGNRPLGAFAFFKSPRAWRGLGLWGGEVWLDRRRRLFYDEDGTAFGYADSESFTTKIQWLYPVGLIGSRGSLQAGFHIQASRESPSSFTQIEGIQSPAGRLPKGVLLNKTPGVGGVIGAVAAFDGMAIHGLNMDGVKGRLVFGGSKSSESTGDFVETEWFAYALFPRELNLAAHTFIGSTSDKTLGGLYYLGGFDSIRGLPDGIRFGNKIAYANFEARIVAAKFTYAHIQPAIFADSGSAWLDSEKPSSGRETSLGTGVRISIPQVYRLVLRVDYGISVGSTKSRGVSIGLNQFFQPYKLMF